MDGAEDVQLIGRVCVCHQVQAKLSYNRHATHADTCSLVTRACVLPTSTADEEWLSLKGPCSTAVKSTS